MYLNKLIRFANGKTNIRTRVGKLSEWAKQSDWSYSSNSSESSKWSNSSKWSELSNLLGVSGGKETILDLRKGIRLEAGYLGESETSPYDKGGHWIGE